MGSGSGHAARATRPAQRKFFGTLAAQGAATSGVPFGKHADRQPLLSLVLFATVIVVWLRQPVRLPNQSRTRITGAIKSIGRLVPMPSAVIPSVHSYAALPLARQQLHQRYVHPGPLVLGTKPLKPPTPTADRDRTVSRRSEPSSRTTLIGEQPNPWDLLQPQDVMSRHRVKRAYAIARDERFPTALSPPSYASVTLWEATAPVKLPAMRGPGPRSRVAVRPPYRQGWYFKDGSTKADAPASKPTTYPTHADTKASAKLHGEIVTPFVQASGPIRRLTDFAEPCVLDKQSPPPGLCPSARLASNRGLLIPKLRRQIAEFLQHSSLKRLGILYQSTCVGFGYGLTRRLFPGTPSPPEQSDKLERYTASVTFRWPGNIRPVPIDYAFRPRLRGRLTLRRLTLRRNPWTFGESVFHTLCRYSCQHSHFPYLHGPSQPHVIQDLFNGHWFGPPVGVTPPSSCTWLDHSVSGLKPRTERPVQTRFRCASTYRLKLARNFKSLTHYTKDRISRVPPYSSPCSQPSRTGLSPIAPAFPDRSGNLKQGTGLIRVRSPLLTESR
ncbi:hypothetical protein Lal_00041143 [Lupinus albus]|nr:hypothetical protein Lal_00041143 [Lupinus albus]